MIISLQELENLKVIDDLAVKIAADGGPTYSTSLINGQDPGGIDVGFMYIGDTVTVNNVTQLGASEILSVNGFQLHDRPPLLMDASINMNNSTLNVHVLVVHMRSRGGIDDNDNRVKIKRFEQANSIAAMINQIQLDFPGEAVITLGDFNAFDFTDGYADVIGQITGTAVEEDNLYWQMPLFANSPLTQAVHTLMVDDQYSYVFQGSAQLLDNAILNDAALLITNQLQFARGQSDVNSEYSEQSSNSLRVSDHDGFVLFLSNDVIFTNGFE